MALAVAAPPAAGQAAPASDMWRVVAATLARPPALRTGPTAAFWNPAAGPIGQGSGVGAQMLQAPDAVGLTALLVGAHHTVSGIGFVGLVLGRVALDDIPRTTTSPLPEPGDVRVHEQQIAVQIARRLGPLTVGVVGRGHEARFDADRDRDLSVDLGARWTPHPEITVAAATHFWSPGGATPDAVADYYAAIEYIVARPMVWAGRGALTGRYATTFRSGRRAEHTVGAGLGFDEWIQIDLGMVRETGFDTAAWRSILRLGMRIGRYGIEAARGEGINDLGATYRFGLAMVFR